MRNNTPIILLIVISGFISLYLFVIYIEMLIWNSVLIKIITILNKINFIQMLCFDFMFIGSMSTLLKTFKKED